MGKSKQAQRTKGNLQPSSSAKAAELVEKSGGALPGQFFILSKFLKSQGEEADTSTPNDSDFCYVLKKMSKKDANTRKKGLQEFGQLSLEKDLEVLAAVLPYWIPHYTKLSLDNDRSIRELCQDCFSKVSERLKNKLAPHLKEIMGTWLLAQCDCHQQSALLAKKAFDTLFREAKQSEAVWFCKTEILKLLTNILFDTTKENIKASDVCEAEEVEDRLTRLQTNSLDALSRFVRLADVQYGSQVNEAIEKILNNQNLWKFHKSGQPSVRRAFFDLASTLCDRGTFNGDSPFKAQVCRSVLLCIDESNPHVIPALWKAVVSVCDVKDCWSHVSLNKAFLPKLFNSLDAGCHGCAEVTHPNLVVIVDKLPQEVKADDKFICRFLARIRNGLNQNSVLMSQRECDAIAKSFVECCKFIIYNLCENKLNINLNAFINEQVMEFFKFILVSDKNSLSCSLKHLSDLVWYLNKMSKPSSSVDVDNHGKLEIWNQVYKALLDELTEMSVNIFNDGAKDGPVIKLVTFYQLLLSSSSDQESHSKTTLRKIVRFDEHSSARLKSLEFENQITTEHKLRSSEDIMEAYKTNEVLEEFIHNLSSYLYSSIKSTNGSVWTMKLFRMLFERFACNDFLLSLRPSFGGHYTVNDPSDRSTNQCFLKEAVFPWLVSIDLALFPEVMSIFLRALTLESEEERLKDFELALTELENIGDVQGRKKLCNCLSLLFETPDTQSIGFWTLSKKCKDLLALTVVDCVQDFMKDMANQEAWNVLCSVLAMNEGTNSSIKSEILSSLKDQLIATFHEGFINETFDFVQILYSHLLETKSVTKLMMCEAFGCYLEMLLWASVKAMPEVSSEVCYESRRTLISTMEVLFNCSAEEKKFEESKLCQKMTKLLLNYVTFVVQDYNQLQEVVDTSAEVIGLFYRHFKDFDFFSDFVAYPTDRMVDAKKSTGSPVQMEIVEKLLQLNELSVAALSIESHIYIQTFYAKLFNILAPSIETVSQNVDPVEDSEQPNLKMRTTGNQAFVNNLIDGTAILSFCDFSGSEVVLKDFMTASNFLVPLLSESVISNLTETRIDLCLDSKTDQELNANTLALYILLKQISSLESLWNSLTSAESCIIERILKVNNVNRNVTKVLMALNSILPEKSVKMIFDKFVVLLKESHIEREEDLSESLLNMFDIINTILMSGDCVKFFDAENSSVEPSDRVDDEDLKTSAFLFTKINEVKQFCEGLFEDGSFNKRIGRFNMIVIDFYKNVVSRFAICPSLAEERWDEVLCFAVSRFQGLETLVQSHSEVSASFECFLQSMLSLILQMSKLFISKEFTENSPRLADEWLNVFQSTIYEYLNPFFINIITAKRFKGLQYLHSLELLCDVILHCPSESLQHFLSSSSSTPPCENGDEAEPLFELLLPFTERCCLQLPIYALLKKFVQRKAEFLCNKFAEDTADDASTTSSDFQSQSEEADENQKSLGPATFLPSLMQAFERNFPKLEEMFPDSLKLFEEVPLTPVNCSEILSYLLTFELILDVFKRSPTMVKTSLSQWFSNSCVARHMFILSSVVAKKPSEHLQLTAHEDHLPNFHVNGDETPIRLKLLFDSLGCEDRKRGHVTLKRKLQSQDQATGEEPEFSLQNLEQFDFRIFVKTIHAFPRVVRNWYLGLDQKSSLQIDKFVTKFVSPAYISKELNTALQTTSEQSGLNFQVKGHAKELMAVYSAEDATIVLIINFPDNSPLSHVRVILDDDRINFVKQLSPTWKLQLNKLLNYKDASVTEALMTLSKSLDRRFDGNSCMICFSLILSQQGAKVLPKMQCKTCKKKFHNACLLKWFESSHNAACPLCRSAF